MKMAVTTHFSVWLLLYNLVWFRTLFCGELENKREWKERVFQRGSLIWKKCQRWKTLKEKHLIAAFKSRENYEEILHCEPRTLSEEGK